MAVLDWAMRNASAYFDNPTARRDYRSQLRGTRTFVFWGLYLAALITISVTVYASSVARSEYSLALAQNTLQEFYQSLVWVLGGAIVLASPALAANAVVAERDRRSLDLIFSAPVTPKAFLIGKLISAYRSIWMMLVLALPVASICVVLGGTTWSELLATFALLSLHGLFYASIALAISAVMVKPVSAVFWSYIAVGGTALFASAVGFVDYGASSYSRYAGEGSAFSAASPFTIVQASRTFTEINSWLGQIQMPNWLFTVGFVVIAVRLLLLGAGSALSPYGAPETRNLRCSALIGFAIYAAIASIAIYSTYGWSLNNAVESQLKYGIADESLAVKAGWVTSWLAALLPLPLALLLPMLVPYGRNAERKYQRDGVFSFRSMLRGTPAGALPFLLTVVGLSIGIVSLILVATGNASRTQASEFGSQFGASIAWALGFWTLCWSLGRLGSAIYPDLRSARIFHLVSLLAVFGLPVPVLTMLMMGDFQSRMMDFHPMSFLWASDPAKMVAVGLPFGLGMLAIGAVIAVYAENRANGFAERRMGG